MEVKGMLLLPFCMTSEKTFGCILATGVESVEEEYINRTKGPRRGILFEPQPLEGVPGQKFTGVARPAGEPNCEPTGVAPALSAQRRGAGLLRSGAHGHEIERRSVPAPCGVWTDPLDEGVEICSPVQLDGAGQKLTGVERPMGVAKPIGEADGVPAAISGRVPCADLRSGAHGQVVLRHDVPASVGVQTGALRGVDAGALRAPKITWTGS